MVSCEGITSPKAWKEQGSKAFCSSKASSMGLRKEPGHFNQLPSCAEPAC